MSKSINTVNDLVIELEKFDGRLPVRAWKGGFVLSGIEEVMLVDGRVSIRYREISTS
jgi:hypothetical protein